MNLLQLVQKVGRDSGTVDDNLPTTVTGETDLYRIKLIDWVKQAYRSIENAHRKWRWLQGEFYGDVNATTDRYASTNFTDFDTVLPIDRFSQWGNSDQLDDTSFSIYPTATGVAAEAALRFKEWEVFRSTYLRGTQTANPPSYFSIDPSGRLVVNPIPDATYTIRGAYRKSGQPLTADTDIPEMPVDFHDCIVDAALILVGGHDEAPTIPVTRLRQIPMFSMLEAQQLPKITWGAPLA